MEGLPSVVQGWRAFLEINWGDPPEPFRDIIRGGQFQDCRRGHQAMQREAQASDDIGANDGTVAFKLGIEATAKESLDVIMTGGANRLERHLEELSDTFCAVCASHFLLVNLCFFWRLHEEVTKQSTSGNQTSGRKLEHLRYVGVRLGRCQSCEPVAIHSPVLASLPGSEPEKISHRRACPETSMGMAAVPCGG